MCCASRVNTHKLKHTLETGGFVLLANAFRSVVPVSGWLYLRTPSTDAKIKDRQIDLIERDIWDRPPPLDSKAESRGCYAETLPFIGVVSVVVDRVNLGGFNQGRKMILLLRRSKHQTDGTVTIFDNQNRSSSPPSSFNQKSVWGI